MFFARPMLAALLLISATTASAQEPGIAWQTDLTQAKETARAAGKLVLLHFWTESCGPCKRLDRTVFNQPNVAMAVSQHFVPVKLNANEAIPTAQALGITRVPTDVVLTPDGEIVTKLISPGTPMEYVSKMSRVASTYTAKAGAGFALAAANSPYGPVVNQAYANLAKPVAPPQVAAPSTPPTQPVNNRYAQSPTAPATVPVSKTNPYATVATSAQAPITPAAPAMPAKPEAPVAKNTPQVPAGAPPLGFDGYCAVTMKKQWQWKKGDPRFGVIHRGKTYLFTGEAEKAAFFKDPDAYAPVLSGVDPVVAIEQSRAVPGLRQYALEYEGKFYLFSSEQTLNKFWANSDRYATGVRQAMAGGQPNLIR